MPESSEMPTSEISMERLVEKPIIRSDVGTMISQLEKIAEELGIKLEGLRITGSNAVRRKYGSDLDVVAHQPPDLDPVKLRELEEEIRKRINIDFYFIDSNDEEEEEVYLEKRSNVRVPPNKATPVRSNNRPNRPPRDRSPDRSSKERVQWA